MHITQLTNATTVALAAINDLLPDLSTSAPSLTMERLQAIVSNAHCRLFLAEECGRTIGMFTLCATHHPCGDTVWLEDIVVAHSHQGRGIGRKLVEAAIEEARLAYPTATLMLTSRPSRTAANHIYSQLMDKKKTNVYQLKP